MSATGTSTSVDAPVSGEAVSARGMSEVMPLPNPLRRFIVYLLGHVAVGEGPPGPRVERDDRLPEPGRLGESHRSRYDGLQHLVAEVLTHFTDDLVSQL